jgi:carbon starvation protein
MHSGSSSDSSEIVQDAAGRPVIPFLFSTIACGALSGFHSLVCAGTTSKQLLRESDSVRVAYGAMLAEGVMAIIAIVTISCGLGSTQNWQRHYSSWSSVQGFGQSLSAFVEGATAISSPLGIPPRIRSCAAGFLVAAFATTTIGATIRIQRYVIAELVEQAPKPLRIIGNPYVSSALAAVAGGSLALAGGHAMALLWPVFGGMNQLLASFTLLVVAANCLKAVVLYSILAAVAFLIGFLAIVANMWKLAAGSKGDMWLLGLAVLAILVIVWMVIEAVRALIPRIRSRHKPKSDLEVPLATSSASQLTPGPDPDLEPQPEVTTGQ